MRTLPRQSGCGGCRAGFDYQIGGAYAPPPGAAVISRDHTASPAAGAYNICYVNAFQAQPDAQRQWPADLLLRDTNGRVVMDRDWNEALLDISTVDKRDRVAGKVDQWIDECARKGFNAIEPDNYDSYSRSSGLLTADDSEAFMTSLAAHAHSRGLAIGQKNTVELARSRSRTHLDFAVAEECAENDECGAYAAAFASHVVVIEYTDQGLHKACSTVGSKLSIVRRDRDVSTPDSDGYIRKTCARVCAVRHLTVPTRRYGDRVRSLLVNYRLQADEAAGDIEVFRQVVGGTHAVVAVGDDQRCTAGQEDW